LAAVETQFRLPFAIWPDAGRRFESRDPQVGNRARIAFQKRARKDFVMNFIIWLIVGGLIGWVASMIMRTDGQQGIILNVVVGIIGAFLGGWLLAPMFGTGTINSNDFSLAGLGVSLLGAVILLAIVNLFRRGSVR
jgi:uncharacterized membrane protein YeaQ/YmgE (transglycosylase-associated protein family)